MTSIFEKACSVTSILRMFCTFATRVVGAAANCHFSFNDKMTAQCQFTLPVIGKTYSFYLLVKIDDKDKFQLQLQFPLIARLSIGR